MRPAITFVTTICSLTLILSTATQAALPTYALSPDGLGVVRIDSLSPVSASSFNGSLLPSGYTSSAATGGSVTVSTYEAGFQGGSGGAHIEALYTPSSAPGAGKNLRWVQVGTDNDPIPGFPSPYLDSQSGVFYDWAGSTTPNASGQLPFYDFSQRSPADLSTINPITWSARLYPTIVDSANHIEVHDGVSWGWTMKKAPVGTTSAVFDHPSPSGAVVSGVGTNAFTWGTGDPSSLGFAGTSFDTTPGKKFKIGTLTYHNGAIDANSGADSVDFNVPIDFTNIPELNFAFKTSFTLVNTPNIDGDPGASADVVSIGSFGYSFHVLEGQSASVDVMATLDKSLNGTPGGNGNGANYQTTSLDPSPIFVLANLSLANPTGGGFITVVPEPSTCLLFALGAVVALLDRCRPKS